MLHMGNLTQDNEPDVSVSMEGGGDEEWLHRGSLTQEIEQPIDSRGVNVDEDNEMLHMGNLTQGNEPEDGVEILAGAETNEDAIDCTNADEDGGEMLTDTETNRDDIEYTIADGGAADEITPVDDQNLSPGERRRRSDRARRAAMSPLHREALNKRRRDARATKRQFKTPQEKKENARRSKLNYKQRTKEQRANNLHPDSIAMANPQFKPKLLFPPGDTSASSLSEEMAIPEFGGTPVYVEADVQEPPQQVETPETFLSNTIHTSHLTPGLRHSRRKRRNQEFEATIERNIKGATGENDNIASQSPQSCVVDNGVTQNYPRGDGTSDALGVHPDMHLVMKTVLRHNHPLLTSMNLFHHTFCTEDIHVKMVMIISYSMRTRKWMKGTYLRDKKMIMMMPSWMSTSRGVMKRLWTPMHRMHSVRFTAMSRMRDTR